MPVMYGLEAYYAVNSDTSNAYNQRRTCAQ